MKLQSVFIAVMVSTAVNCAVQAQDTTHSTTPPKNKKAAPTPLDDRGGLPIPENLMGLKNLSLAFWVKFRSTNQQVYRFVNEAAQFQAYTQVCKRHELNISLAPITELANRYIQAAIPAHYDEPEFALLEPLGKQGQQAFLEDMSSDLYAFEFGFRIAEQNYKIQESGQTKKSFCKNIAEEYKHSYIALRATAQRRLEEFSRPAATN